MKNEWRAEDVLNNFGEHVETEDDALRIFNRLLKEFKINPNQGFTALMLHVREVLKLEGHDVPLRISGYRRAKK